METMFRYIALCVLSICCFACTKQEVIDTGISSPYYEGSVMDFLRGDEYNFGMTVKMIERAGLVDLFEGTDADCPEITFLAFKTHTVYLYLLNNDLDSVPQLSPAFCKNVVLHHVIGGKYLKQDVGYRNPEVDFTAGELPSEDIGGSVLETLDGGKVLVYREKTDYAGVPDMGPEFMYSYSLTDKKYWPVATPDIQPKNGVIHALTEYYRWDYKMAEWQ